MDAVVGPAGGDEGFAQIAQGRFTAVPNLRFGHHDPCRAPVQVDHLAVADLIIHLAEGMDAKGSAVDPEFRRPGHLDLGDQAARRRVPAGELDAGRLADHATSSIAADEIFSPQRATVGQRDVDAAIVLRETGHLAFAIDGHRQLADPAGQDALDVVLPQTERVVVPGGEVADVQRHSSEPRALRHLPLRQEPIGDATLIKHLDRARVQTAGARACEVLVGAPLDNGDVDLCQGQLARQHQACRTAAGDHHGMPGHCRIPLGISLASGAPHSAAAAATASSQASAAIS